MLRVCKEEKTKKKRKRERRRRGERQREREQCADNTGCCVYVAVLYANPKKRILLRRKLLPRRYTVRGWGKKNLLTRSSCAPDGIIIKKLPLPPGPPSVRGLISPRVLLYLLFSLSPLLSSFPPLLSFCPTRNSLRTLCLHAHKLLKSSAWKNLRDGVTMSGISEWKRFFRSFSPCIFCFVLFCSKNRFANSVVGVFFHSPPDI